MVGIGREGKGDGANLCEAPFGPFWQISPVPFSGTCFGASSDMGIRFYCPNGHKLNVKEFQAGRRAICPYCGTKTQIPTSSTRKTSKQRKAERRALQQRRGAGSAPGWQPQSPTLPGGASDAAAMGGHPGPVRPAEGYILAEEIAPVAPASSGPIAAPAAPSQSDPHSLQSAAAPASAPPSGSAPGSAPQNASAPGSMDPSSANFNTPAATTSSVSTPPPAAPAGTGDPLAEAGDMVWYVRPPSGGQFGPAGRDVMRTWLAEGRISPDSLVWREGWRDWQEAAAVFPRLAEGPPAYPLDGLVANVVPPIADALRTLRAASREQSRRVRAAIVIGLLVALVILILVFLLIWLHQSRTSTEQLSGRPTAVVTVASIHLPSPPAARPRSA